MIPPKRKMTTGISVDSTITRQGNVMVIVAVLYATVVWWFSSG
jgi:hypothetical protein